MAGVRALEALFKHNIDLFSAGVFNEEEGDKVLQLRDVAQVIANKEDIELRSTSHKSGSSNHFDAGNE